MATPDPAAGRWCRSLGTLVSWVRRPVSLSCGVAETVITAFAVIALVCPAWVALWLRKHRW